MDRAPCSISVCSGRAKSSKAWFVAHPPTNERHCPLSLKPWRWNCGGWKFWDEIETRHLQRPGVFGIVGKSWFSTIDRDLEIGNTLNNAALLQGL
jgi:hypothetical protein